MQSRVTTHSGLSLQRTAAFLRRILPAGHLIPEPAWRTRHATVVTLLWLHIPIVFAFSVVSDHGVPHAFEEGLLVTVPAVLAALSALDRRTRSLIATGGLLIDSAVLVHLSHGAIEVHFHYFVMLSIIALYQDWAPFLFSIAFVAGQHSLWGFIEPDSVFSHTSGRAAPLTWGMIHGGFVLLASVANLAAWKISERYTLFDPLTDLANRSLFRDRLEETLASVAVQKRSMAVLYVDLDRFKEVNDALGHDAGDEVLIAVAQRLRACTNQNDLVARLGGDEFGLILVNVKQATDAMAVAEEVIRSLSTPINVQAGVVQVGASVGIAIGAGELLQSDILVRAADRAMYVSKADGRGRYTMHDAALPAV